MNSLPPAAGARPEGTQTETDAAANVQRMFDTIAPTYDRANHLLSFGLDRLWWRRAARVLRPTLQNPRARILDLCCGTGDMTAALLRHRSGKAEPILVGILLPKCSPGLVRNTPGPTSNLSRPTLSAFRLPRAHSSSSPLLSASAIWRTTLMASRRSIAFSPRAARSPFSSATSQVVSPGRSTLFTSSGFSHVWVASSQAHPLHTAIFRPRSNAFPVRHACSLSCSKPVSRTRTGPATPSARQACIAARSPDGPPRRERVHVASIL